MESKPKRTRRTAEEKEAERLAKLCKCSAGCQIPSTDAESIAEHGTTCHWCGCKDYGFRGGSYRDEQGQCCRHIHAQRVLSFQAPAGSPLAAFQQRNPLGLAEDTEALITKLCGPPPAKRTTATQAQDAHQQALIQRLQLNPHIDVNSLLGGLQQTPKLAGQPRRTLRRIQE